MKIALNY